MTGECARVLVVEDHPDIRAALQAMLSELFLVDVACDGIEGLERARSLRPALVISDLVMPGLSGTELCRAIRADPSIAHTPVIILTAHGELHHKLDGFESGADDYLQKPFNAQELLARTKALIDNHGLQRQLARKNEELEGVLEELRNAQKQLLEGERLRTALQMAGALAHEFNNPLSAVLGLCEIVLQKLGTDHPSATDIESIAGQARRIADVVRRIQNLREVRLVPYVGRESIIDLGPDAAPGGLEGSLPRPTC